MKIISLIIIINSIFVSNSVCQEKSSRLGLVGGLIASNQTWGIKNTYKVREFGNLFVKYFVFDPFYVEHTIGILSKGTQMNQTANEAELDELIDSDLLTSRTSSSLIIEFLNDRQQSVVPYVGSGLYLEYILHRKTSINFSERDARHPRNFNDLSWGITYLAGISKKVNKFNLVVEIRGDYGIRNLIRRDVETHQGNIDIKSYAFFINTGVSIVI